ncbi:uncharacterized protein LOC131604570 [Vicia villosa]|uniref:uncharacterized protein LOC131604570 n=1 Tax=Vicia villosa TaxID=3911 RepID=UPI00273CB4B8|nr:uncharacterized protein LOC131604570 [Vicia villosa]
MATENNLTTLIERIMANNGLNIGLRCPNYTSLVADYILQIELPRGTKVSKFTKFSGDTSESTVEHIAQYLTEASDLANSENLRIKYFPSSLTNNAFTWFTTLPPNSIDTWAHLERMFHEQFYMGQTKITKKARANKNYKKERVAYVEAEDVEIEAFDDSYGFDEVEIDLAELKEAPPYSSKLLTLSNGKNPVETDKNDKFPKKTYTFEVTKDLIQNAIKDGCLKFADKGRNNMKVDTNPLNFGETNYAELVDVNMVDVTETDITEGEMVSAGKKATESLSNNVIFNTEV